MAGIAAVSRDGTSVRWQVPTEAGPTSPMHYLAVPYILANTLISGTGPDGPDFLTCYVESMLSLGWVCPEHDRLCTLATVQGAVDIDTACNATCERATGTHCNCACGGRNHGAAWDLAPTAAMF